MVFEWWKHRKEAKELGEIREEIVDVVKDELDGDEQPAPRA
jgi:hypothetical protein